MSRNGNTVSDYWGTERRGLRPTGWSEHPVLLRNLHRRVTGDPNKGTYQDWCERFFKRPASLALSLGCGFGGFERDMIKAGAVQRFHAMDVSEGAIRTAINRATNDGLGGVIDYKVMDLNQINLPANTYDAIFAISSAHHIFELEHYFKQCRLALKPNGLLFLDEYIGPSRIQCPDHVVTIINRIRELLPERYKRNSLDGGAIAQAYANTPVEHFEANDPSEAIRSAEILGVLAYTFEIVEVRRYGGAILHMLLSGLAGNFDETNDQDVALLEILALMEELLEESGRIQSDFASIVARPKAGSK